MASFTDLMGLGQVNQLANVFQRAAVVATAFGTSVGSANQIQGNQYFTVCNTGTSSFKLPPLTPNGGAYLGDQYNIYNQSSAAIQIYAANTPAGSTVTIYGSAASTGGTTGVAVPAGAVGQFQIESLSSWAVGPMSDPALQITSKQQLETFAPTIATAFGTSVGSANSIGAQQYFTYCNTGTSSFVLPAQSNSVGPYLGDRFTIANMSSAAIQIYSGLNQSGSTVILQGGSVSASGAAGVAIPAGYVAYFQIATPSVWVVGIASV